MSGRRLLSILLVLCGAVLLAGAGLHYLRGYQAQSDGRRDWVRMRASDTTPRRPPEENPGIFTPTPPAVTESSAPSGIPAPTPAAVTGSSAPPYPYGKPVARLRIPSAEIDSIVFGGADDATLEKG